VIAIIWVDAPSIWATRYPWAIDRRTEIIRRVAEAVIRQRARGSRWTFDEASGCIHILQT
jgi:hypothetical protein